MDHTDDSSSAAKVMPPEGPAVFVGPFRDACEYVRALSADERAGVRIESPETTYLAADIEVLRGDRERE